MFCTAGHILLKICLSRDLHESGIRDVWGHVPNTSPLALDMNLHSSHYQK